MKFENKVVLVTGGNFGIGRGIVHKFASEGASVAIVARNEERARQVLGELDELGFEGAFFKADVSDEKAVVAMIYAVIERFGRLDILGTDPIAKTDARVVEVYIKLDNAEAVSGYTNMQVEVEIHI